jgi:hypothetical protein
MKDLFIESRSHNIWNITKVILFHKQIIGEEDGSTKSSTYNN